ncbi:MAG TPA: GNAT family N-acetyltransferase, partial [Acidimicrobiia bacterium]
GVEPAHQGEGLGGTLLDAVLGRLDTTGVPAYLETSTEANVAWYRHHGFEMQQEIRPAPAGPPVWTMWREPRG